ncbi:hypothetical protein ATCVBr0604L_108L [Acanthocystis turfacea Chlorella virus Br0604L]|nr:hypothetical protein ATCVBr0604L_108L [Acanthocystis turfacea Chlorella virus Br0604L]
MTTLQYYFKTGEFVQFPAYTIDNLGVVKNANTGYVLSKRRNKGGGYNIISVYHKRTMRSLFLARAIISTFLGPPPTVYHTAEHKDQNRGNDVLSNIIWEDKSGQRLNQTRPVELHTAYIIVKDDVEHTAKEWVDIFKKPNGKNYTIQRILQFAQEHNHGFRFDMAAHGCFYKLVKNISYLK